MLRDGAVFASAAILLDRLSALAIRSWRSSSPRRRSSPLPSSTLTRGLFFSCARLLRVSSQNCLRSASSFATCCFTLSSIAFCSGSAGFCWMVGAGVEGGRGKLSGGGAVWVFTVVACAPCGGCAPKWVTPSASTHL